MVNDQMKGYHSSWLCATAWHWIWSVGKLYRQAWPTLTCLAILVLMHAGDSPASGRNSVLLTPEEQVWLKAHADSLVLYYNTGFPPIEFTSPKGDFDGLASSIVGLIENKLGVSFIKRPAGGETPYAYLEKGESDIAPAMGRTPEREAFTLFTTPYLNMHLVLITNPDLNKGRSLEDFKGKRIAAVSGFAAKSFLAQSAGKHIEIVPVSNALEGLVMVSLGQVDGMVENLAVAAYYIQKSDIQNLSVTCDLGWTFGLCIGVSRHDPVLHSCIQKVLDAIPQKEFDDILDHWVPVEIQRGLDSATLNRIKIAAWFIGLLLAGLGAISVVLKRKLAREIKNLKLAQQAICDQAELIRLAMDATQAGVWDFYPKLKKGYLSKEWDRILCSSNPF